MKNKMKITKKLKDDFMDFWDFWLDLTEYAKSEIEPDDDGESRIPISNCAMIAAYAAHAWFSNKGKSAKK